MARLVVEIGSGKEAKAALDAISSSVDKLGGRAKVLNGDLRTLDRQNASTERRFKSLAASLDPNIRLTQQYERAQRLLQRAMQQGIVTQREHDRLLGLARGKYLEAANGANTLAGSFGKLSGIVGGLSLAALGRELVTTIADFEQLRARLETVTGSAEAASAAFDLITDFAKTTPFSVQEITDSFVRLQAQGITPTREVLLSFGNTAAAMGKSFNQFTEAVLDAATGEFERLKEFGIKAKSQGDQVTFTFRGMSQTVAKESDAIVGYLQKIGSTDFAGAMERQSKTLAGQLSNLKDAASQVADGIGRAGLSSALGEAAELGQNLAGGLGLVADGLGDAKEESKGWGDYLGTFLGGPGALFIKFLNDAVAGIKGLQSASGPSGSSFFGAEADARWLKLLSEAIVAIEESYAKIHDSYTVSERDMDAATDKMLKQAAAAEKLAEETRKARENLVAMSHIEALPTGGGLSAGYLGVPEALQDEYDTYLKITGLVEDYTSTRAQLNRLVEQGVISEEQAAEAIRIQAEGMVTLKGTAEEVNSEWQKFVDNANENFLRGVQSALSGFFVSVLDGGEDAMENLVDSLKNLLFKLLAEYLAEWVVIQGKMLIASLSRIGKEKAAQSAANASGGDGSGVDILSGAQDAYGYFGNGGGASTSGLSSALGAVALWYGLVQIGQAYFAKKKSQQFGFGTTLSWDYNADAAKVTEGASELSKQISAAMRGLLQTFQETTGAWVTGMGGVTIMARNDGKKFAVQMEGVALGTFSSMGEAIVVAFSAAMKNADFSAALDPAIESILASADQNFETPEALMQAISLVQELSNMGQGLTELEVAIKGAWSSFEQLESKLRSVGVQAGDAARLAGNALLDQMSTWRDEITGRNQSIEEQRAAQERKAALWNAERQLILAELKMREYELQQRLAILGKLPGAMGPGGGGGGAGGGSETSDTTIRNVTEQSQALMQSTGNVVVDGLNAQVKMYSAWAESTTEITAGTLNAQVQMSTAAAGMIAQQAEAIMAQLVAVQNLIAAIEALPPITAGEIKIGGGGKSGKAGKGGKGLGGYKPKESLPTPEEARELVAQYLRTGFEQSLAEIRTWYAETIALYQKLGLSAEEVDAAMEARLADLGQQALAALGSPTIEIIQRFDQLREALDFLNEHAEDLGISIEDLGQITEEVGFQMGLSLVDSLLQFVDNEDARRQLEQARYEIEIANIQLQFTLLQSLGLLTEEMVALIQGLLDELPDEAPSLGGSTSTTGGGYYGGGYDTIGDNGDAAMERLTRALERLADYYEQLQQDETVSPLSLAERYSLAEGSYQDLLAQIAAAQAAGDVELLADLYEQLPDVAQQYLELAAQMFGTSTQAYQDIFQAVLDTIEGYLGGYQEPDQWQWLRGDMDNVRVRMANLQGLNEETNNWLWNIRDILVAGGGSGTSSATSTATTQSAYSSAQAGPQISYLPPPTGRPVVAAQPPVNVAGLERQVDQLRRDLTSALDRLTRAQDSASDRRNRAAGGSR